MGTQEDLRLIRENGDRLTDRQAQILRKMRDEDKEFAYEKGWGCVGLQPTGWKTLRALLAACAVSQSQFSGNPGGVERYQINETGRAILARRDQEGK